MRKTPSRSFWSKYRERWDSTRSLVCVGLDSELGKLPQHLRSEANPIWEFNRRIIDATCENACAYKPNLAFYLADGLRGLEALYRTVEHIPAEIPVILDCKVGDIGNTMQGYVSAFFEDLGIDAITFNPLMGADVAKPILTNDSYFGFALALTSNPSASDFLKRDGLAEHISAWLEQYPSTQIGAVLGATQIEELRLMRSLLKGRILLIPGVGAQGGDLKAVMENAIDSIEYPDILINSSRGIIFKDSGETFAETAGNETLKLKQEIAAYLG
ncbi:MAG TPA: orotidine-5'-phosphate decarboxylase [Candidatus Cloacimonadota bacterium]|nr:orotidine-5'-phosphate decarboxylase [Candidatus Cloacimonadota bacterium]